MLHCEVVHTILLADVHARSGQNLLRVTKTDRRHLQEQRTLAFEVPLWRVRTQDPFVYCTVGRTRR
jgi:hypothetical protein